MNTPFPTPTANPKAQASVDALKSRLDWGEPALTIIDLRDREAYLNERIRGAVFIPQSELVDQVTDQLEPVRDIYLYGQSDEATATAASSLRSAGYQNVAELQGGLAAWKSAGYPVEAG